MPIDTLFKAIELADIDAFQVLIGADADIDEIDLDEYQATPLSYACDRGAEAFVTALLDAGADINRAAFAPPLVAAATHGFGNIVSRLIAAGADLSAADESGQTALWIAAARGFADIARLLVEAGADPTQADLDGKLPAVIAEENGHGELAAYLNQPFVFPESHPLWEHSDRNAKTAAKARLDELAAPTQTAEDLPQWTFSKGMATLKLGDGCVTQDFTSLASSGNVEVTRAMLDASLHPDWVMFRGQPTALMQASRSGELGVVELLLERGADPNYRDDRGQSALHLALFKPSPRRHPPVVERLLAAGADPNAADNAGQRPLHMAIHHAVPAIVKALINAGGDPFIRDRAGRMPADWLQGAGKNAAAVKKLLEEA